MDHTSVTLTICVVYDFRHLERRHSQVYKKYLTAGASKNVDPTQPSMASMVTVSSSDEYGYRHPKSIRFAESLVENLIVACGIPFSVVEKEEFIAFIKSIDPKLSIPTRQRLTYKILPQLVAKRLSRVKEVISSASTVALTMDIWTDRAGHSFLAITAHTFVNCIMHSCLIAFSSFRGSHTGSRIAEEVEKAIAENELGGKVDFVVTDNASNMKRAFDVMQLHSEEDADEPDDGVLDDDSMWEDIEGSDEEQVRQAVSNHCSVRLPCFAHTLQLVVKDGLAKLVSAPVRSVIAKCSKLCSLVHQSQVFKDAFESKFGEGRSLPKPNDTRWNSTFRHLQSIADLNQGTLTSLLNDQNQKQLILSQKDLSILNELIEVLLPFADATDLTQGERYTTIGCIAPTVVAIDLCLIEMGCTAVHHVAVIKGLQESLRRRFRGLFQVLKIIPCDDGEVSHDTFGSLLYPTASVLDPAYGLVWLNDHPGSADIKQELKETVTGTPPLCPLYYACC